MSRPGQAIKAVLLQVHSIAGLVLALLLALIALTGAIMSFEDEIVDHLNAGIMQVAPRAAPVLMPDELVARLKAGQDLGKVSAVTLSSDPAAAVRVRFARDEQGARPTSLYVDPYDAHVLGAPRGEEFFATVRKLHRWLLIPGDAKGWGRQVTGVAALGLIVMLISGLVLRWPRRAGSVKMWLKPNLGLSGRGLHRSLHAVIGTWVLPVYLVMTLTGLWYSFDWYKDGVVWLLSRPEVTAAKMQPKMSAKAPRASARPEPAQSIGFDPAWTTFRREEGDRFAKALLTLPAGAGTAIRIRSWGKDSTLDTTRDEFRIDAAGQVMSAERYADKTFGEKIIANVLDIHRGAILGWPGKLAFMIAAALMPLFSITGILLYLSRRRLRRPAQPPLGRLVPGE
ncbi:putative iron-regulated membrane protein [Bradyrhizobium sp. YR681]|uniref:PepSY-associated TM helix domain-containing protein n=1 Tax=Bradyrhizobium sp. YR681 TaxID=1144344 RepID=UPI000270FCEF|nr:PepSY-associated TM helix domain-containing protein [Bradyrhizobium sp. YR681]EJN16246.1 putative iron-regulated membrane protein [Bradyrhizobium sp. YR681]